MGFLRLIVHMFVVAHMIITATFGLQATKMSLESSEIEALFDPLIIKMKGSSIYGPYPR